MATAIEQDVVRVEVGMVQAGTVETGDQPPGLLQGAPRPATSARSASERTPSIRSIRIAAR